MIPNPLDQKNLTLLRAKRLVGCKFSRNDIKREFGLIQFIFAIAWYSSIT
jgi:hypothetical protein